MRTLRRRTIIPAVTLAMAMTACGSDDDSSSTASTTAAAPATAAPSTTAPTTSTSASTEATSATLPAESVDSSDAGSGDVVITATVGQDTGEDRIEEIPLGANVTLTIVNPNADDEFHVHGFDLGDGEEVKAGEPKTFNFTADKAGEWEVESHDTDQVLLILKVG
jgi:hypothetical protein